MAANHRSTKQTVLSFPTASEFRLQLLPQAKPRATPSYRSATPQLPKSSLIYPTLITRSPTPYHSSHHQCSPDVRYPHVATSTGSLQRAGSARTSGPNSNPSSFNQQGSLLNSSRPHPHYNHFLAYLRRQSLARLRRKQEQQELGHSDNPDTTTALNTSKTTSQSFQSTSSISLATLTSEICAMPMIHPSSKQKPRPMSPYGQLQRSSSLIPTNYRLTFKQSVPLRRMASEKTANSTPLALPSQSETFTPTNSLVNETHGSATHETPYELKLSGDMLSYCYVSDSGVAYKGQLLATPVQ